VKGIVFWEKSHLFPLFQTGKAEQSSLYIGNFMRIIKNISEMQKHALELKRQGKIIGFVPTMGYLHQGHISLLQAIRGRCDILVVSIFINPTQFAPGEDFERYPRDFARDEKMLQENKCDILFYPETKDMYPEGYATYVNVERLSEGLCGKSRPGHFRGVATVVAKLFLITQCDIACFGQKDAQQAAVVKRMVKDLNIPVEIIIAPIVREPDGLAMSSRNIYLSPDERRRALCLKKSLDLAQHMVAEGESDTAKIIGKMLDFISLVQGAEIDYIEAVDLENLTPKKTVEGPTMFALAVKIGKTRLIDNVII
jgi:pantoate--beta-alanine ligase